MRTLTLVLLLFSAFSLTISIEKTKIILPDVVYGNNNSFILAETQSPEIINAKINGIKYKISNGTILIPFSEKIVIENGDKRKEILLKTVEVRGKPDCETYRKLMEEEGKRIKSGYGSREILAELIEKADCNHDWNVFPVILAFGLLGELLTRWLK